VCDLRQWVFTPVGSLQWDTVEAGRESVSLYGVCRFWCRRRRGRASCTGDAGEFVPVDVACARGVRFSIGGHGLIRRGVVACLQDDEVRRLRLYIAGACCRLRKLRQVRFELEQCLVAAKKTQPRDPDLERYLMHALRQRASRYRKEVVQTVARVRNQFNNNRALPSAFKLLLQVLQCEHSDACGALVRVAAVAGADGNKR
jgi:hypothetical protein